MLPFKISSPTHMVFVTLSAIRDTEYEHFNILHIHTLLNLSQSLVIFLPITLIIGQLILILKLTTHNEF